MQFLFAVSALLATVLSQQITPGDYRFNSTKSPNDGVPTCLLAIREGSKPHILNVGFARNYNGSECHTTFALPPRDYGNRTAECQAFALAAAGYFTTFNYNGTSYVDVTKGNGDHLNQPSTITIAGKTVIYARKSTSFPVCAFNYELELVTPRPRGK